VTTLEQRVANKRAALAAELDGQRVDRPPLPRRSIAERIATTERQIAEIKALPERMWRRRGLIFYEADLERLTDQLRLQAGQP
jgi:hypothetical protein